MIKYLSYFIFVALLNGSVSCASMMMMENPYSVQGKPYLACYVGEMQDVTAQPQLYLKIHTICNMIYTKLYSPNIFQGPIVYYWPDGQMKVLFNQTLFIYRPDDDVFTLLNGQEMDEYHFSTISSCKKNPIPFTLNGERIPAHHVLYLSGAYIKYSVLHRLLKLHIIPQISLTHIQFNTQDPAYSTVTFGDKVQLEYNLNTRMFESFDEKSKTFRNLDLNELRKIMGNQQNRSYFCQQLKNLLYC